MRAGADAEFGASWSNGGRASQAPPPGGRLGTGVRELAEPRPSNSEFVFIF